ncbi:tyrosine-type recombinase/integrase [Verrucosispora sp. NA02020]|nr:tyrosine-type recombinase/integrase [Verrucosispora sp. NA02020]
MQTALGDPEVLRDLPQRRLALTRDRDHVTTELRRKRFRHDRHPSSEERILTGQESTKPGAVPLQDIRRYQPSTVSRRLSVVVGFYRVCVIDAILEHSPADYVRRPTVPAESPTLGLGHLQFEALITTARNSSNPNDFALVALLGLLGLRIFETCGANITDLGEEHGHRVLRVRGKGGKVVLVPLPPAVARAIDRAVDDRNAGPILRNIHGGRMDRHAATRRLKHLAHAAGIRMPRMHPHMLRHTFVTTMVDAGVSLRDVQIAARHADPRTTMRYDRARKNLDRHPNYILAAYMASGT